MHNSERNMIAESDVELLEASLDGELTASESEALRARLGNERALVGQLEHLRAERKVRAEMFSSLGGGEEAVVERALSRIDVRQEQRSQQVRRLRYAMAAAALIAIGFLVGW